MKRYRSDKKRYATKATARILAVILALVLLPVFSAVTLPGLGVTSRAAEVWNLSYHIGYDAQEDSYILKDIVVETDGTTIGNITLTPSQNMVIDDTAARPASFEENRTDSEDQTISYKTGGIDADTLKAYLAGIRIQKLDDEPLTLEIDIDGTQESVVCYEDEYGLKHYYEQVTDPSTWEEAYNGAKSKTYMGLQGYLATITSEAEHDFIYTSIADVQGWLGGTRAVYADGSLLDDEESISLASMTEEIAPGGSRFWYWACGPEAGEAFWDGTTVTDGQVVEGGYDGWNPGEPNNAGGEAYLQFAWNNSKLWNDFRNSNRLGYYVEFGGYPAAEEEKGNTDSSATYTATLDDTVYEAAIRKRQDLTREDAEGGMTPETAIAMAGLSDNNVTPKADMLDAINAAIANNEEGAYPLTFVTPRGNEITVLVSLKKDPTKEPAPTDDDPKEPEQTDPELKEDDTQQSGAATGPIPGRIRPGQNPTADGANTGNTGAGSNTGNSGTGNNAGGNASGNGSSAGNSSGKGNSSSNAGGNSSGNGSSTGNSGTGINASGNGSSTGNNGGNGSSTAGSTGTSTSSGSTSTAATTAIRGGTTATTAASIPSATRAATTAIMPNSTTATTTTATTATTATTKKDDADSDDSSSSSDDRKEKDATKKKKVTVVELISEEASRSFGSDATDIGGAEGADGVSENGAMVANAGHTLADGSDPADGAGIVGAGHVHGFHKNCILHWLIILGGLLLCLPLLIRFYREHKKLNELKDQLSKEQTIQLN